MNKMCMNNKLHTKFGNASINKEGYYYITSQKEGNFLKKLHRLIFEDFYGFKIPKDYVIHHKNGIKTDNCILNLQLLKSSVHIRKHQLGKQLSDETKQKIRDGRIGEKSVWYGKKHLFETRIKQSKYQNTTGFYGVGRHSKKDTKQGFYWEYLFYDGKKQKSLCSVDLLKLKKKVLQANKEWVILDLNKVEKTLQDTNYTLEDFL